MMSDNLFDFAARAQAAQAAINEAGFGEATLDDQMMNLAHRFGYRNVADALERVRRQIDGPIPQGGQREDDPRTSRGKRSSDLRRFSKTSYSGRLLTRFSMASESGLTDKEATDLVVGDVLGGRITIGKWEGCRRRCGDLRDAGYLVDSGAERNDRIVWVITPHGVNAYRRMEQTGWSR